MVAHSPPRGENRRCAGPRPVPGGSQGQALEGRARHGLLHRGGWTVRVHGGSGFRVLAVVCVPHPTHGLTSSSQRPPPRCELPQDRAGFGTQSPGLCPVLPAPSRTLEALRGGEAWRSASCPGPAASACAGCALACLVLCVSAASPTSPERGCAQWFTGG